jgi:hypothetical protein
VNVKAFVGALAIWGIADSLWLAFFPASWANWWGRFITRMGAGGAPPRILAVWELVLSLALFFMLVPSRRRTSPFAKIAATFGARRDEED